MARTFLISEMGLIRLFESFSLGEKRGVENMLKTLSEVRSLSAHNQVGILSSEVDSLNELVPRLQQVIDHFNLDTIHNASLKIRSGETEIIILFWIIPKNQTAGDLKELYEKKLDCPVTIWTFEDLKAFLESIKSRESNQAMFYSNDNYPKKENITQTASYLSARVVQNPKPDGNKVTLASSFTAPEAFNVSLWLFALLLLSLDLFGSKSDALDEAALVPAEKVPNPSNSNGKGSSEPANQPLADIGYSFASDLIIQLLNPGSNNASEALGIEDVEDHLTHVIFRPVTAEDSTISVDTFLVEKATFISDQSSGITTPEKGTGDSPTVKSDWPAIALDKGTYQLPTESNPTWVTEPLTPNEDPLAVGEDPVNVTWHPPLQHPIPDKSISGEDPLPLNTQIDSPLIDVNPIVLIPIVPIESLNSAEDISESIADPIPADNPLEYPPVEDDPQSEPRQREIDCLGAKQRIVITPEDGQVTVWNFGGVGKGTNPSQTVIDEVDYLKFIGAEFDVHNMIFIKSGNDLIIRFEGVEQTKIVLKNFQLENIDNFLRPQASKDLANVLFAVSDAEPDVILDSFDVVNDDWKETQVLGPGKVTFLNNKDNEVSGYEFSDDVINGQNGHDTLRGLSGNDLLRGGFGNDTLIGGEGQNELTGNEGADQFGISLNGFSQVNDFQLGQDFIKLLDGLNVDQLRIHQGTGSYSNDTWITLDNNPLMLLKGVSASMVTPDRFLP